MTTEDVADMCSNGDERNPRDVLDLVRRATRSPTVVFLDDALGTLPRPVVVAAATLFGPGTGNPNLTIIVSIDTETFYQDGTARPFRTNGWTQPVRMYTPSSREVDVVMGHGAFARSAGNLWKARCHVPESHPDAAHVGLLDAYTDLAVAQVKAVPADLEAYIHRHSLGDLDDPASMLGAQAVTEALAQLDVVARRSATATAASGAFLRGEAAVHLTGCRRKRRRTTVRARTGHSLENLRAAAGASYLATADPPTCLDGLRITRVPRCARPDCLGYRQFRGTVFGMCVEDVQSTHGPCRFTGTVHVAGAMWDVAVVPGGERTCSCRPTPCATCGHAACDHMYALEQELYSARTRHGCVVPQTHDAAPPPMCIHASIVELWGRVEVVRAKIKSRRGQCVGLESQPGAVTVLRSRCVSGRN